MARLDLYRILGLEGCLLEIQADLLAGLATTVVVPLLPLEVMPKPMTRLNPIFEIDGAPLIMVTQSIATVPRKELGARIGSLEPSKHYEILNALDMLLSGS